MESPAGPGMLSLPPLLGGGIIYNGSPGMLQLYKALSFLQRDEEGQGLAEYALVLALIAIVAIIALVFLGNQVQTIISNVGKSI